MFTIHRQHADVLSALSLLVPEHQTLHFSSLARTESHYTKLLSVLSLLRLLSATVRCCLFSYRRFRGYSLTFTPLLRAVENADKATRLTSVTVMQQQHEHIFVELIPLAKDLAIILSHHDVIPTRQPPQPTRSFPSTIHLQPSLEPCGSSG